MSRFDKFFNNIMNKEARLYRRLQDLDDLIYDRYFNEFTGKTVYTAEVLSESSETDSEGPGGNSTMFMPIRVRIDGIHTNQIPDPYKAISGLPKEAAASKFRTLFMSHPLAYPDTEIYSDSATSQPLNRGDRIEVFFAEEGPQNGGKQRGLRYGRVIAPAIARTVPAGVNVSDAFEVGDLSTVGDVSALFFVKETAIDFIDRLKDHPSFQGYSIPALAGVAANAAAESNFKFDASGDPEVKGARIRAIDYKNRKYCSFGFFQLNVCGDGAEGMLVAQSNGWMTLEGDNSVWNTDGQSKFISWIKEGNGNNQLVYVGEKLKSIGLPITTDSAYEFGEQMTVKFEKPINKETKGKQRGATAEKILEAYNKSKGEQ